MTDPVKPRRSGCGRARARGAGLILWVASAVCVRAEESLIEVLRVRVSEPVVSVEIRNNAGKVLNVLDEKRWNRRNYLKVGVWRTTFLAPPPRSSDERPDLDGVLGPVRWMDRPADVPEAIVAGASAAFAVPLPPHFGFNRYYVVVLVRAGERFRTEIIAVPVLNRLHVLTALLFLLFLGVEARTKATATGPGRE